MILTNPTNASLAVDTGTGTIDDNDAPVVSIDDVSTTESGDLVFTVSLSKPSARPTVSVQFSTVDGTGVADFDYSAQTGVVTFLTGETTKTVILATLDDSLDEDDETLLVELSNPTNLIVGDGTGVGTIVDNDDPPLVSVSDVSVTEGGDLVFVVSLSSPSGRSAVSVDYATSDGTASSPGDFTSQNGTLTFLAGETSKTVTVSTIDDLTDEFDETVTLALSNLINLTAGDLSGTGTIFDNNDPPGLSIDNVAGPEGQTLTFTVTLSLASEKPISVDYSTNDVTTSAGSDYSSTTGTLSFPAGTTSLSINVSTVDDALQEGTETFATVLSAATNATIQAGSGIGTLIDDDPDILVEIEDTGVFGEILQGETIDFGTHLNGTTVSRTLRLTNEGDIDLDISSITVPTGFILSTPLSTNPILANGGTATFEVSLDTSRIGDQQGTLSIASNDLDESPYDLLLTGTVLDVQPEIMVSYLAGGEFQSGGIIDFGSTFQGEPVTKYLLIENTGDADLNLNFPASVNGFIVTGGQNVTLGPNDPGEVVSITFTGAGFGFYDQTLTLQNDDFDESDFALRLIGQIRDPGLVTIIDNQDPGYSSLGDEWTSPVPTGIGHDNDYEYYPKDSFYFSGFAEGSATWSATGLSPGFYRVSATWPSLFNRDTESNGYRDGFAQYNISAGSDPGTVLLSNQLNQRADPNDRFYAGSYWEDIGIVQLPDGDDTLDVVLVAPGSEAGRRVIADAVRFEFIEPEYDIIQLPGGRDRYQFDVRSNDIPDGDRDVRAGDTSITGLTTEESPKVWNITSISGNGLTQVGTSNVWVTPSGSSITINPDGSQTYRPSDPFNPDLPGFNYALDLDPSVVFAYSFVAPIVKNDVFTSSHSRSLTFDVRSNDDDPQGDALYATIDGVVGGRFVNVTTDTRRVVADNRLAIQVEEDIDWTLTLDFGSGPSVISLDAFDDHGPLKSKIEAAGVLPAGVTVSTKTAPFSDRLPRLLALQFNNMPVGTNLSAQVAKTDPLDPDPLLLDRGALTSNTDGTFTYAPNEGFYRAYGEYSEEFFYTARDAENGGNQSLGPALATVHVINDTPWVSAPDRVRLFYEDGEDNLYRIGLGAFDADGDPLELIVTQSANNGSVITNSINSDGSIIFRAADPFPANPRVRDFSYQVTDGYAISPVYTTQIAVWDGDPFTIDGSIGDAFFQDPQLSIQGNGWEVTGFAVDDRRETSAYANLGSAVVDVNSGGFQVAHSLDADLRQTTTSDGAFQLVYDSQAADRQPVIHSAISSRNSEYVVDTTAEVRVSLNWYRMTDLGRDDVDDAFNGIEQVYNTTPDNTLAAGLDDYRFTLQAGLDADGESIAERYGNGVYIWEIESTFTIVHADSSLSIPPETRTIRASGEVLLTDDDLSEGNPFAGFGNGWGIAGLPSLWVDLNRDIPGVPHQDDTAILVNPGAESRLFIAGLGANSADPWRAVVPGDRTDLPKDLGTLTRSGDTFTYLAADQTIYTFAPALNSAGALSFHAQLRRIEPPDGAGPDTFFNYFDDGRIQTINSADNSITTFVYTAGNELDEIQMPGGRTLDVTVQPATSTVPVVPAALTGLSIGNLTRSFIYDAESRLQFDVVGTGTDEIRTEFGYDADTSVLTSVTIGTGAEAVAYGIRPAALYTSDDRHLPAAFANHEFLVGELTLPTDDLQKYDWASQSALPLNYDSIRQYFIFNEAGHRVQESTYAVDLISTGNPAPFDERPQLSGDAITNEIWEWDNFDNVTYFTDSAGRETRFTYDYNRYYSALNRTLVGGPTVINPVNQVTTIFSDYQQSEFEHYDNPNDSEFGQLRKRLDAKGEKTENFLNTLNQLQFWDGPEFLTGTVIYDPVTDLVSTHTDERGVVSTFVTYDSNRRATQVSVFDPVSTETRDVSYVYSNPLVDVMIVGGATSSVAYETHQTFDPVGRVVMSELFDFDGTPLMQDSIAYLNNGLVDLVEDGDGIRTKFSYDTRGFRTTVEFGAQTPAESETTTTAYYDSGAVKSVSYPDGHTESFYMDPKARQQWGTTDRIFLNWDLSNNPVFTLNAVETTRDIVGNIIQSRDRLTELTTDFEYDFQDRLIKQSVSGIQLSAASGATSTLTTTYTYDGFDRIRQVTGPDGVASVTDYDDLGNVSYSAVLSGGVLADTERSVVSFDYDISGRSQTATEYRLTPGSALAQQLRATFVVDGFGRFQSQVDRDGRTSSAVYSFSGGRTAVDATDRNGVTTRQLYDGASQLRTVVSPAGDEAHFTYTLAGRLDEEILQENGMMGLADIRKSQYGYDALGRSNSQRYFDDIAGSSFIEWTSSYSFGLTGRNVTSVDPNGNQTVTDYDSVGAVTRVTQPDPLTGPGGAAPHGTPITEFAYSFVGLPGPTVNSVTMIDPLGRETRSVSNNLGWMLEGFDADGVRQVANDYDRAGRVIRQTDALGQYTQTEYFLASGLPKNVSVPVAAVAAVGGKTQYEYDSSGNMVKLTDPAGNITEWEYDEISRRTTETVTMPTFDATGSVNGTQSASRTWLYNQLITDYTDRNGRSITYVVDPATRTSTETWDNGRVITFTSNAAGQLVEAIDVAGVKTWLRTYDYNDLGWLLDESFELNDGGITFFQTNAVYSYTDTGVRNDLRYSLGGTEQIHQVSEVDGLDRVWKVTQSSVSGGPNLDVEFTFRADSSIDSLQRSEVSLGIPSFVSHTNYDYFSNGDLQTIEHRVGTAGGSDIATYIYEYDDLHRITKITSPDWPTGNVIDYDAQSQLTSASETGESFTYDVNGNRTNSGYITADHNLLVEDNDYRYVYDVEGNRTRRIDKTTGETIEYEWDHRNRLVLIVFKDDTGNPTKRVEYEYNLDNLRIAKEVHTTTPDGTGSPDSITRFAYDGDDVVLVFDGQNSNSVEHRYFHGPGVDQIFADEDAMGQVLWALTDHQGSVRDWIDETGSVEHHTQFDSFGNIISPADPSTVPTYAYTGREWDVDAGLYYYRARWYDPATGRFVGDDPSGFDAGDSNLQRYVGNNSPNIVDPTGLQGGRSGKRNHSHRSSSPTVAFVGSLASQAYDVGEDLVAGGWAVVSNIWSDNNAASSFGGSFTDRGEHLGTRVYDVASNGAGRELDTDDYGQLVYVGLREFSGANSLSEGIYAIDLQTETTIEGADRLGRGLSGGGGMILLGTSSYSGISSTVNRLERAAGFRPTVTPELVRSVRNLRDLDYSTVEIRQLIRTAGPSEAIPVASSGTIGSSAASSSVGHIEVHTLQNSMATRQGTFEIVLRGNEPIGNLEINAAQAMQWRGYNVVLRTPIGTRAAGGTSDLLLDGIRADIYAPFTGNADRVLGAVFSKNSQLPGGGTVVLDLRNSTLSASDFTNIGARLNGAATRKGVELNIRQVEIIDLR